MPFLLWARGSTTIQDWLSSHGSFLLPTLYHCRSRENVGARKAAARHARRHVAHSHSRKLPVKVDLLLEGAGWGGGGEGCKGMRYEEQDGEAVGR